jgi:hypothetical protein
MIMRILGEYYEDWVRITYLVDIIWAVDVVLVRDMEDPLVHKHRVHVVHPCGAVLACRRHQVESGVVQQRVLFYQPNKFT